MFKSSVTFTPVCFADVNECGSGNGGCTQLCRNEAGTHSCYCTAGFTLNHDGVSCDGQSLLVSSTRGSNLFHCSVNADTALVIHVMVSDVRICRIEDSTVECYLNTEIWCGFLFLLRQRALSLHRIPVKLGYFLCCSVFQTLLCDPHCPEFPLNVHLTPRTFVHTTLLVQMWMSVALELLAVNSSAPTPPGLSPAAAGNASSSTRTRRPAQVGSASVCSSG